MYNRVARLIQEAKPAVSFNEAWGTPGQLRQGAGVAGRVESQRTSERPLQLAAMQYAAPVLPEVAAEPPRATYSAVLASNTGLRPTGYFAPLVSQLIEPHNLDALRPILNSVRDTRGMNGSEQLTQQLMHKTGWSAQRLMRYPDRVPKEIEGYPLSSGTIPGQADTHVVLVNQQFHDADVAHAFAITSNALRELQNRLWADVYSSRPYLNELKGLD